MDINPEVTKFAAENLQLRGIQKQPNDKKSSETMQSKLPNYKSNSSCTNSQQNICRPLWSTRSV